MLITLLLALTASATEPAHVADFEIISAKRDAAMLEQQAEAVAPALGACAEHTGGLNYGQLTLSFMVDKRGKADNISVRSNYVLPTALQKCLVAPIEELELGRGDVAVAKFKVALK